MARPPLVSHSIPRKTTATAPLTAVSVLVILLPATAALDGFRGRSRAHIRTGNIDVHVEFPSRTLVHESDKLIIHVAAHRDCHASLELDASYLDHLQRLAPAAIGPLPTRVEIGPIRAGEERRFELLFEAHEPLWASGSVSVSCGGSRATSVPISTFIFP
jgi:hypothetical protein